MRPLLLDDAKRGVREALADIARVTSAQVIVSVRGSSASYRHADYLAGALVALALLCLFLYHPEPFDYAYFPLEQMAAFILGALLSSAVPALRRLLAGRGSLALATRTGARAAFVELGVGKTPQRNGVLVYVSSFESAALVVCDVGIDEEALGKAWVECKKKLERSVRLDRDVDLFVAALKELGPVLAEAFPLDGAAGEEDDGDEPEDDEADADGDDATDSDEVRS